MPQRNGREVIETFLEIQSRKEWDRLPEVLDPGYVETYPQSGETIRGIENARAVREDYPGGRGGLSPVIRHDVVGAADRWVMSPSFTVMRIEGSSDRYTYVLKTRYPDGSDWYVISIVDVPDGLITRASAYFAPEFPAPDWRAPYREA